MSFGLSLNILLSLFELNELPHIWRQLDVWRGLELGSLVQGMNRNCHQLCLIPGLLDDPTVLGNGVGFSGQQVPPDGCCLIEILGLPLPDSNELLGLAIATIDEKDRVGMADDDSVLESIDGREEGVKEILMPHLVEYLLL